MKAIDHPIINEIKRLMAEKLPGFETLDTTQEESRDVHNFCYAHDNLLDEPCTPLYIGWRVSRRSADHGWLLYLIVSAHSENNVLLRALQLIYPDVPMVENGAAEYVQAVSDRVELFKRLDKSGMLDSHVTMCQS
jgi:hypothetical protein